MWDFRFVQLGLGILAAAQSSLPANERMIASPVSQSGNRFLGLA